MNRPHPSSITMLRAVLLNCLLLLVLTACTCGCLQRVLQNTAKASFPHYAEVTAKWPPIATNSARVVFYRVSELLANNPFKGQAPQLGFSINGIQYGLSEKMFIYDDLRAGRYLVVTAMKGELPQLTLVVQSGATYYVRMALKQPGVLVPESQALDELQGLHCSQVSLGNATVSDLTRQRSKAFVPPQPIVD